MVFVYLSIVLFFAWLELLRFDFDVDVRCLRGCCVAIEEGVSCNYVCLYE